VCSSASKDDRMTQGIVDHAELEGRLFTQGFNMTRYGGVNQIQNRIGSFQQALVYCISELLD
jgi:hypothetical protein